jgi:hypothetical protein
MAVFGPFNFHQSAQQRSQQFHQEAAQRAREMHQQAQQRAQQSAQGLQWLREVHERQHQQWLDNLKAGYWTEQQHHKQQVQGAQQLGALQKRPSLLAGQPGGQVPQRLRWRPAQTRTVLQPAVPPQVRKERGGCARVVGGLCLFLFLGFCVSQAVILLLM